jgi:hypothetical protein
MYKIPTTVFQGIVVLPKVSGGLSHLSSPPNGAEMYDGVSSAVATSGAWISVTSAARNPALDIVFDCRGVDVSGNDDQGIVKVTVTISGSWISVSKVAGAISLLVSVSGTYTGAVVIAADPIVVTVTVSSSGTPIVSGVRENFVAWSDIGSLSFTIGRANVAGERPLDWSGRVYVVKKLHGKVVVYGENGVSFLVPSGTTYGLNTINRTGIIGRNAVTGDDSKHFFIDKTGQLWLLTDTLQLLDYSEYLSSLLSTTTMLYDAADNLVYICDGAVGFVYSPASGSLGKGPVNLTGLGRKDGTLYVTSSSAIVTDPFEICTDIIDMRSRNSKTIYSLEFGTDLTGSLYTAVDYRSDKALSFSMTPWRTVNNNGVANIVVHGREFRIRVRLTSYEYFEIDYIKIDGVVNDY